MCELSAQGQLGSLCLAQMRLGGGGRVSTQAQPQLCPHARSRAGGLCPGRSHRSLPPDLGLFSASKTQSLHPVQEKKIKSA